MLANNRIGWARADKWREDYENRNISPQTFKVSEAEMAMFSDVPPEVLAGRNITSEAAKIFGVKYNENNNSWILPIRDPYSYELWGWQEKFIDTRLFRNYPQGIRKSKTLFGLSAFADGSTAILVESPIDAMRVSTFGAGSGLACSGLQVSDFQLSIIFERSRHVVLALDNDSPGIRETARICRDYKGRSNFWVFDYGMTKAKDPGEMTDEDIMLGFSNMRSGLRWLTDKKKMIEKLEGDYVCSTKG
jgi:DNA primase